MSRWFVFAAVVTCTFAATITALSASEVAARPPGFPASSEFVLVDPAPYVSVGAKGSRAVGFTTGDLGQQLFDPVLLDGFIYSDQGTRSCHQNGASRAVCVTGKAVRRDRPGRVWVLDLDRGALTYSGETDLWAGTTGGPGPHLLQVGNPHGRARVVATVVGEGVYGVGEHAGRTWFVPGSGQLVPPTQAADDASAATFGTQVPTAADPEYRVFSVIDGAAKTPAPPSGTALKRAVVWGASRISKGPATPQAC